MCAVVFGHVCFTAFSWLFVWLLCFLVPPARVSLLGCLYPIPRVIMAMADDGLLFRPLAKVRSCSKTPLNASLASSGVAGEILTRMS